MRRLPVRGHRFDGVVFLRKQEFVRVPRVAVHLESQIPRLPDGTLPIRVGSLQECVFMSGFYDDVDQELCQLRSVHRFSLQKILRSIYQIEKTGSIVGKVYSRS